jgi:hypothetical protein
MIAAVVHFRQSTDRQPRQACQRNNAQDQYGELLRVGIRGDVDGHQDAHDAAVEDGKTS